jgi:hypothetical protein
LLKIAKNRKVLFIFSNEKEKFIIFGKLEKSKFKVAKVELNPLFSSSRGEWDCAHFASSPATQPLVDNAA